MYGVTYEGSTLTLDKHDCGLLSNASVTFNALQDIHMRREEAVKVIWPKISVWNKPGREADNVYELYFKPLGDPGFTSSTYFNYMIGDCGKFDFKAMRAIKNAYFTPSDSLKARISLFETKYGIDYENTLAILYRGTDKILEVPRVHPMHYLEPLKQSGAYGKSKILIVTDQKQALSWFQSNAAKCFNLAEMPLADESSKAMHLTGTNNYELGLNYLAAVIIISRCKYVVFDTNNAGLWVCLWRDGLEGTCQIHAEMQVLNRIGE